jgi:hypothetical protein
MSLQALLDLAEKMRKFNAGELPEEEMKEIEKRRLQSYERMKQYDREIEERIRLKQPTQELLNKLITL